MAPAGEPESARAHSTSAKRRRIIHNDDGHESARLETSSNGASGTGVASATAARSARPAQPAQPAQPARPASPATSGPPQWQGHTSIARLLQRACPILMLTGAGLEMDSNGISIEPNVAHALGALVACTGGALVTTNITDATLLAMPQEQPDAKFTAPHGTMCDQRSKARDPTKCKRRRPRSYNQLNEELMTGRGVFTEVPIKVEDTDPNVVDTHRAAAQLHLTTLIIVGNSIVKSSNGKALNFLSELKGVSRVLFVNPDTDRPEAMLRGQLEGWGLPKPAPIVECIAETATEFAETVLRDTSLLHSVERQQCESAVKKPEVKRKRAMLQLPPKELGGREIHKFGKSQVSAGDLFDAMQRMHES